MLVSGRYLYVAFTCEQTIEKLFKAVYVKEKKETPPYTHNLIKLLSQLSINKSIDKGKIQFIELLNSYYIESRYTEEINEILKTLNKKNALEILNKTEEMLTWLKKII